MQYLACFLVIGFCSPFVYAEGKRPNVLFFFSDDQRADTIGALGNKQIRTPNLDQLVQQGTTLNRVYCMGSTQGAVCVPSRAMLLSGRTLFRVDSQLKGQRTWPEQFAQAGYRTFVSGKWHNGGLSVVRCFQGGKAIFLGGMTEPYSVPVQDIGPDHKLRDKYKTEKHCVEVFADCAIDFLKQQQADTPFVCYVPFNAPHDPRTAPKEYHALYEPNSMHLPANYLPQHPFNNGELSIRDELLAPWPRTKETIQKHLADYYAAITFLDAQIGRVLKTLQETGLAENTIIVFTSDHGLSIGSHGLMGKQNLYDHSMRSPCILVGPGIPKNYQSDALAYLLDLFPTLGEMAQIPAPEGSEGKSLLPILQKKQSTHREAIFTAYTKVQRAIRDERWKLIVYPQINKSQLFDLKNDPHELTDLSQDPKHTSEKDRLWKLLKQAQTNYQDQQPLQSDNPQPAEFDFTKVKLPMKK